jgi:ribonuclease PH
MPGKKPRNRSDNREPNQIRPVQLLPNFIRYPEGSVLIKQGDTHVLCNVTVEAGVPAWMQTQREEGGWVTAEYAMLPRATHQRSPREILRPISRNQEIRRLIGRALRASIQLHKLPPITCIVDCDVLQADGGTRTAAITGGYVALMIALQRELQADRPIRQMLKSPVAAISVGWLDGQVLLDLNYEEDSSAEADLNVVMNRELAFIEIQGTAERGSISRNTLEAMLDEAQKGIEELLRLQSETLRSMDIEL